MKRCLLSLLLVCVFTVRLHSQTPSFITDSLDAYIHQGLADWKIPGLAVAIVKDGKVVMAKGFGNRKANTTSPVDENTLFYIASNTKLFTGTAMALLEEQQKLVLDDKVKKYLPQFALYDSAATDLVTIRDLLAHRLGTKSFQGDFLYWDTDLTRQDVVRNIRRLKPAYPFRQEFGYSNQGYVTAAEIIPKVSGQSWETFIDSSILKPLNMTRTFMSSADVGQRSNVAYPYTTCCNAESQLTLIPYDNLDNLGPATGMISSINDMAKWLTMQLDSGRLDGKRVLPWAVLEKTRSANTIVSSDRMTTFPLGFQFYCLGTGLIDYAGTSVFAHAGACFGFRSTTTIVPQKKLGIMILTNQDNHFFHEALRFQILDAYLGVPHTNRHRYYFNRAKIRDQKNRDGIKTLASRVEKKLKPELPLSAYTGTYQNDLYGMLSITAESVKQGSPRLIVRFQHHPNLTGQLDYMDGNEFRLTFSNPRFGIFPITFSHNANQVDAVEFKATEFVDNDSYIFRKKKL